MCISVSMQFTPQPNVTPEYTDSVHTGNVVGQQIMQQNVHHHTTQYQQVIQPCMGCGNRNYLRQIRCSSDGCHNICCDNCVNISKLFKREYCKTHANEEALKVTGVVFGLIGFTGLLVVGGFVLAFAL